MANGVSCAFFAGKNLIYGQKEQNVFKEGIGGIQAVRTIDSAAQSGMLKVPTVAGSGLSKLATIVKKALYPLIVLSGIYNTVKSDDKVKTGINQAGSIATMFTFETVAEKYLIALEQKLKALPAVKNNKKLAIGLYALKGAAFIGASMLGYKVGDVVSSKSVDKVREIKANKNLKSLMKDVKIHQDENDVFENIEGLTKGSQES